MNDATEKGSRPHVWIYAVLVAAVMVGALLGWIPRWPGLAQEVALPPLDLFADVRVLMARLVRPGAGEVVPGVGVGAGLVARLAHRGFLSEWILCLQATRSRSG